MIIVVGWSAHNARYYVQLAGLPRNEVKIVTEPHQLRGVADGTRIIVLGPSSRYFSGRWSEIDDMLQGRSSGVDYDDTDRLAIAIARRDEFMDEARIRFLEDRYRNGPTREQADATFTAALHGDEAAADTVREWSSYTGQQFVDHDRDTTAAITRARRSGRETALAEGTWTPDEQPRPDARFTADMARETMAEVRERVRRSAHNGPPDWSMAGLAIDQGAHDRRYGRFTGEVVRMDPPTAPVPPTPPPVPASGHYDEPDGWGNVPRIPDEPTGDSLWADRDDIHDVRLRPGERPVW